MSSPLGPIGPIMPAITAATMQQATARQAAVTGGASNTAVHSAMQSDRAQSDRLSQSPRSRAAARTPTGLLAGLQRVEHKHRSEDDPRRPPEPQVLPEETTEA